MKKRFPQCSMFILILALFLNGCGASAGNYAAATAVETMAAVQSYDLGYNGVADIAMDSAVPAAAPYIPMEEAAIENEIAWEEDSVSMERGMLDTSPQEISTVSDTASVPLERKLIRNMDLTVETTEFDSLIDALQAKVTEFNGYIEQSDISGNSITNQGRPSKKYAHMTLRIPANKLDSFISQVEAAGNITYKSENVSDVTLQYSDIQSRLKTLRMEQERLWELLGQADTTEAIVLLEERLTEVSSEIESYESRMRYLDNSVTYSTVYLSINEVDMESPTKPETAWQQIQRGFTKNLIDLMDNLTQLFIGFLSNLPVILFLAFLVLIVVLIVRRTNRRRNAKRTAVPKDFPISSMHFSGSADVPVTQEKPDPDAVQGTTTVTQENVDNPGNTEDKL